MRRIDFVYGLLKVSLRNADDSVRNVFHFRYLLEHHPRLWIQSEIIFQDLSKMPGLSISLAIMCILFLTS